MSPASRPPRQERSSRTISGITFHRGLMKLGALPATQKYTDERKSVQVRRFRRAQLKEAYQSPFSTPFVFLGLGYGTVTYCVVGYAVNTWVVLSQRAFFLSFSLPSFFISRND